MSEWRFLNTGLADGAFNMALDQALVQSVQAGASAPIIRFFGWDPPAVSLGYNQKVRGLDIDACRKAGFDVVRRPTGGRAVIHQEEFTYSVIAPEDDSLIGGTTLDTYRRIAEGLLAGLDLLGVRAEVVRSSAPEVTPRVSDLCFAAAGRYEITVRGKKLVGSAQRRMNGTVLQQGSLLLVCRQSQGFFLSGAADMKVTTLNEVLGRELGFGEVAEAMKDGFVKAWGVGLLPGPVTETEKKSALALADGLRLPEK